MSAAPPPSGSAMGPPSSPPAEPRRPVDVVYIAGAHRSGGTALGTLLATGAGVFYGGELYRFPFPIFDPGDPARRCSCGSPVALCPFWAAIRADADAHPHLLSELRQGQVRFESWPRFPLTLPRLLRKDPELARHASHMAEFVRILADHAGASVVVESSYNPLRGILYRRADLGGGKVRFLHLVRDGRNFLGSELGPAGGVEAGSHWQRVPPAIVARWLVFHLATLVFCARGRDSYLRIRYEDLLRSPRETLGSIQRFLGIDLSAVVAQVEAHTPVPMVHVCAANRARLSGSLTLRPELASPAKLTRAQSALFWAMAGWLAFAFGYRPGGGKAPRPSS